MKQLAKRIDGVFPPNSAEQLIYFMEVQFQKDELLYHRLFTEIYLDQLDWSVERGIGPEIIK